MINKDNYIEFIVDYYDGKLPEELQEALFSFLKLHPDIHEEFLLFGDSMLSLEKTEQITTPDHLLQQLNHIPESVFSMNEDLLVAYCEGDLSGELAFKVNQVISSDPYWASEHRMMVSVRLTPDRTIVFPSREKLLQRESPMLLKRMMYTVSAAAATLLLAYMLIPSQSINQGAMLSSASGNTPTLERQHRESTTENYTRHDSPLNHETQESSLALTSQKQTAPDKINNSHYYLLEEMPAPQPLYLDDIRNEYQMIYELADLKSSLEEKPLESKTGTLTEWKDWSLALFSGKASVKDNPASDVTLRDVTKFGISNISQYASENMSFSRK